MADRIITETEAQFGVVNVVFGVYSRDITSDINVGRQSFNSRRGFMDFAINEVVPALTDDYLELLLRLNLTAKAGTILDTDELQIVQPATNVIGDSVLDDTDEGIYLAVDGSSAIIGTVPYNQEVGELEISLGGFADSYFSDALADGEVNYTMGLRFKNNTAAVNWTFERLYGANLVVRYEDSEIVIPGRSSRSRPGARRPSSRRGTR